MRNWIWRTVSLSAFLLWFIGPAQNQPQSGLTPWTLVWSDEFDSAINTTINTDNWLIDNGTGYGCFGCPSNWGTGEVEVMSGSIDNLYHDGAGHLVIKPIHGGGAPTAGWTSARIETVRTDLQPPPGGVLAVESSIQQPNVSGAAAAGYWPAFWMLGEPFRGNYLNWPTIGEIDVMENINGLSSVFATLHCGTNGGGPCNEYTGISSGQRPCSGCQTTFHTYRVEFDKRVSPQELRWYLDGVKFFAIQSTAVDDATWTNATGHGFFIIFDVAIGGGFPAAFGGGPTAATASGTPMVIDYVRVYQQAPLRKVRAQTISQ